MAKLSGGGIGMNKNVREGVKGGSRTTRPVNVAGLSQLGTSIGSKLRGPERYTTQNSAKTFFESAKQAATPMGNTVAAQTVCGVGGSRTVYRTGTQQMHGAPVQGSTPAPRDILSEFGGESNPASAVKRR